MPNYAHHTFDGGGVALWHITETSDELYALLATDKYDTQLAQKHHEARRAEWLAVRMLVKNLFGSESEVAYHATGRPYLKNSTIHLSISHTKQLAAIAYHYHRPIGVDVEYIAPRIERIAHRFTSAEECAYIDTWEKDTRTMYYLINWSVKEALYKLYDSVSMADFKNTFHIAPYRLHDDTPLRITIYGCEPQLGMPHGTPNSAIAHYRLFANFVCAWAFEQS